MASRFSESLLSMMQTVAMEQANDDIATTMRKRGSYNRYTDEQRASMGQYALTHGNSAAAAKFSVDWGKLINESTVRSIKRRYIDALGSTDDAVDKLPKLKQGRPLILGTELDEKVQDYIIAQRREGCIITREIVVAFGMGIVRDHNEMLLKENGSIEWVCQEAWLY